MYTPDQQRRLERETLLLEPPTAQERCELKARLSSDPHDLSARLRLHHGLALDGVEPDLLYENLRYFCEHAPTLASSRSTGIVTVEGPRVEAIGALWRRIPPDDPEPLAVRNAIAFFAEWDVKKAIAVADSACTVRPDHEEIHQGRALAHLRGVDLNQTTASMESAYYSAIRAREQSNSARHQGLVATIAFETGRIEEARSSACAAIASSLRTSLDSHWGHTTAGRIALPSDVETAESELEASVCDLGYGGPSLRLARDLAALGRVARVRWYLVAIANGWSGPRHRCREWIDLLDKSEFGELVNAGR